MMRPVAFTPAQERIAMLLADGLSVPQVALRVGRSYNTVNVHIRMMAWKIPGDGPPVVRIRQFILLRAPI